ncbi:MAG TPA: hypothetical protein VK483_17950 [Chitinophagaceae bacterium]|nr:hypothetical protein [Chitinophagaceae bacterium]
MTKSDEKIIMKAIALCYKPYLKPEEAMIYCNLERTQLNKRCEEFGIYKNSSGYIKREDLDKMMSGNPSTIEQIANQTKIKFKYPK